MQPRPLSPGPHAERVASPLAQDCLHTTTVRRPGESCRRQGVARGHLGPTLGGGMFSSPACSRRGAAPEKPLATEEAGQDHCQAEHSGSQGGKSRSRCPSVSANLAWPKSQSPGATALLKGVMWGHGQQLLLHASFIQSSGEGVFMAGSPRLSLGSSGVLAGGRATEGAASPRLRAGRGLQPSNWGSLAWATRSCRCPALFGETPMPGCS